MAEFGPQRRNLGITRNPDSVTHSSTGRKEEVASALEQHPACDISHSERTLGHTGHRRRQTLRQMQTGLAGRRNIYTTLVWVALSVSIMSSREEGAGGQERKAETAAVRYDISQITSPAARETDEIQLPLHSKLALLCCTKYQSLTAQQDMHAFGKVCITSASCRPFPVGR